ncbi:MAG TPA: hypothetical protein VF550_01435 [Polyangia bacterium]
MPALGCGILVILCGLHLGCRRSSEAPPAPSLAELPVGGSATIPAELIEDLDPLRWRERCELHREWLTEAIVPIKEGNDRPEDFDRDYLVASVALFPHARVAVLTGCIHGRETHARVRHCAKCMEAQEKWIALHPQVDDCGKPRRTSR